MMVWGSSHLSLVTRTRKRMPWWVFVSTHVHVTGGKFIIKCHFKHLQRLCCSFHDPGIVSDHRDPHWRTSEDWEIGPNPAELVFCQRSGKSGF